MDTQSFFSSILEQNICQSDIQTALNNTILSASGWRRIFAITNDEKSFTEQIGAVNALLAFFMAESFADFAFRASAKHHPVIVLATDARPTGDELAMVIIASLLQKGADVQFLGISAAPEIMAYSHEVDAFVYISASHNPVGHNGVKFGLNKGGVLSAKEILPLVDDFKARVNDENAILHFSSIVKDFCTDAFATKMHAVFASSKFYKDKALTSYKAFTRRVVSATDDDALQDALFDAIALATRKNPLSIVCDFNGSARTVSIDKDFLTNCGLGFFAINDAPKQIAHEIIPEPENLIWCAKELERLQSLGEKSCLLGYMPDCDGDRGNIVYWDEKLKCAQVIKAQEVFALAVMAELAYLKHQGFISARDKVAVAVNDPTSLRINEIAKCFGAQVFRAEVGEANVVNLAKQKREEGFIVPILGEGSNGGNITHPAAVRDPINTIFALVKLLTLRDTPRHKGLFHLWCSLSCNEASYKDDFTLGDVLKTLPVYTTTGVSQKRAVAPVTQKDHAKLKACYQKVFEDEWAQKKDALLQKYGFASYQAISNNGTEETLCLDDYSTSNKGGLKIQFFSADKVPLAFIWMRGSGTESVFRVMCDIKGDDEMAEKDLLEWHTKMLLKANANSLAQ